MLRCSEFARNPENRCGRSNTSRDLGLRKKLSTSSWSSGNNILNSLGRSKRISRTIRSAASWDGFTSSPQTVYLLTRRRRHSSGTQCMNGVRKCGSKKNSWFGVCTKCRQDTRNTSDANSFCISSDPRCSITEFENATSKDWSRNGRHLASPATQVNSAARSDVIGSRFTSVTFGRGNPSLSARSQIKGEPPMSSTFVSGQIDISE